MTQLLNPKLIELDMSRNDESITLDDKSDDTVDNYVDVSGLLLLLRFNHIPVAQIAATAWTRRRRQVQKAGARCLIG